MISFEHWDPAMPETIPLNFTIRRANKCPFKDLDGFSCVSVNCQNLDQLDKYVSSDRNKVTLGKRKIVRKFYDVDIKCHLALYKPMPTPSIFISHFYQWQRIELK